MSTTEGVFLTEPKAFLHTHRSLIAAGDLEGADELLGVIDTLAASAPRCAATLLVALTTSRDEVDRATAAIKSTALLASDARRGMAILRRLLSDESAEVRYQAAESLRWHCTTSTAKSLAGKLYVFKAMYGFTDLFREGFRRLIRSVSMPWSKPKAKSVPLTARDDVHVQVRNGLANDVVN